MFRSIVLYPQGFYPIPTPSAGRLVHDNSRKATCWSPILDKKVLRDEEAVSGFIDTRKGTNKSVPTSDGTQVAQHLCIIRAKENLMQLPSSWMVRINEAATVSVNSKGGNQKGQLV